MSKKEQEAYDLMFNTRELKQAGLLKAKTSIVHSSVATVLYIFLSCVICSFIDLGGIWCLIIISHLVAIGSGIGYCIANFYEYEELKKL